ncbi:MULTISPECIES: TlpA family protein disulfide reductase [Paenibacillus]|uniref:TlpA family protein disulfide reductase n=1 Tax=Paenibacillus TaxID=44249 RepID=UPI0022B87C6D|nr:thioredoxin domain-containing protein [Paenibacillus caseinilyticus]MCZ8519458.1 thioredoxin domain-containing protein [Paenibacillus caseinilyticus]
MNSFLFYSVIALWLLQIPIIFFLVVMIRSLNVVYMQAMSNAGIREGGELPAFEAKSMTSGRTLTKESLSGKPTLIGFVAPGCKRCKAMLPHWNAAYAKYHDQVNFVLIGYGSAAKFEAMLRTHPVQGELLPGKELFELMRSKLAAFAYYADADGRVRRKGLCENMEDLRGLLDADALDVSHAEPKPQYPGSVAVTSAG